MKKLNYLHYSIRTKLQVMLLLVSFITIVISFAVFIYYDILSTKESLLNELKLAGNIIAKRVAPAIEFDFTDGIEKYLYDLTSKSSVEASCLYGKNFDLLATNISNSLENFSCPSKPPKNFVFDKDFLKVTVPIYSAETNLGVGSLFIMSNMKEINDHLLVISSTMSVLAIVIMLLVYILSLAIQKFISEPIIKLTETAGRIKTEKHYTAKAEKFYNDETGTLVDAFNTMMEVINSRDNEIKKINQSLETRVEQRTKQLEEEKIRAEAANMAKTEFLRNMSHEFRTPLHGMLSFASYGVSESMDGDREKLHRYFTRIVQVTERLTKLVEGILTLSWLESGREVFNLKENDLVKTINAALDETKKLAESKGIRLILKKPKFKTTATFDRDRIIQVVINILGNAIKFTPENKKVVIDINEIAENRIKYFEVNIKDEGSGIPEDELELIFEKFTQSTRTKTGAGGTGLGLSIAAGIIEGHKGKIFARNNAKVGSTFTFIIPKNLKAEKKEVTS